MRINLQDKKLLNIIEGKLDVRLNDLALKLRRIENDIRLINSKLNQMKQGESQ